MVLLGQMVILSKYSESVIHQTFNDLIEKLTQICLAFILEIQISFSRHTLETTFYCAHDANKYRYCEYAPKPRLANMHILGRGNSKRQKQLQLRYANDRKHVSGVPNAIFI